ncbi:hypothetical protein GHT07_00440 [Caenimonas koreensis DSM 17982]|uniref:Uncharacterized protein n=1 Tax=Caenimonas koreensis DSM 17982 TaxID=1121255 RepID=A0A844B1Z2_9BURK|nr:hypothetical protein [Caenimonas koreensis]MRD45729.1 hypothetical protein [Caenimonas koreensis DSM 17982]
MESTPAGDAGGAPAHASTNDEALATALSQAQATVAEVRAQLELAKAASVAAAESQRQAGACAAEATSVLAAAKTLAEEATALSAALTANRVGVTEDMAAVKAAKEQAAAASAEVSAINLKMTTLVGEIEALKVKTQTSAGAASDLLDEIKEFSKESSEETAGMTAARAAAKESESLLAGMAEKASAVEQKLAEYEAKLLLLRKESESQLATIVGLLPGATSAGLAFAFDARGKQFIVPTQRWQTVFLWSVVILVGLALSGLWQVYQAATPLTYDQLFRLWLARLPIAGALIWLALYASRESALAKRLEEDYGYKAAVAASFQGFNKQMSDLTGNAPTDSPIAKLCSDTLATIGSPPGRIYDKHQLTISPTSEISDGLKELVKLATGKTSAPDIAKGPKSATDPS